MPFRAMLFVCSSTSFKVKLMGSQKSDDVNNTKYLCKIIWEMQSTISWEMFRIIRARRDKKIQ